MFKRLLLALRIAFDQGLCFFNLIVNRKNVVEYLVKIAFPEIGFIWRYLIEDLIDRLLKVLLDSWLNSQVVQDVFDSFKKDPKYLFF